MESNRIIKLLLPNNNIIKIQLAGNEDELRDLISTITDLSPSQIKGVKDSQGNYYTISSVLKIQTPISNNQNDIYELIWSKNKTHFVENPPVEQSIRPHIIFSSSSNVGNYYANYFIKEKMNKKPITYFSTKKNKNEIYHLSLKKLLDSKQINYTQYIELVKMVNEKNVELVNKLKLYFQNKIDANTFVNYLWYICGRNNFNSLATGGSAQYKSETLSKISTKNLEEVYSMIDKCFPDNDGNTLKEMILYENKYIITAIKEYILERNFEQLINSFYSVLYEYKAKSRHFGSKPKSSTTLTHQTQIYTKKHMSINNLNERTNEDRVHTQMNSNLVKNPNIMKKLKHNNPISNQWKSSLIDEKEKNIRVSVALLKNLSDVNKIIFKYLKEKKKNSLDKLKSFYKENATMKKIEKQLNEKCFEFLENDLYDIAKKKKENITKEDINYIKSLIESKNKNIIQIFNNFNKTFSIEELLLSIVNILKLGKRINISSSSSDDEESKNEKEKEENIKELFIECLDELNFEIKDKESIIKLVKANEQKVMQVVAEYEKNRNIQPLKQKLLSLLNKQEGAILTRLKMKDNINKKIDVKNEDHSHTPFAVRESKGKLYYFLKANTHKNEKKEDIIEKQKGIISILYQEKCIDKNIFEKIKKKVDEKDEILFSAFEVYALTKDHDEFIETLKMISSLTSNYEGAFFTLLNSDKELNETEKGKLITLFYNKSEYLRFSLEQYETNKDLNELYRSFKILSDRDI